MSKSIVFFSCIKQFEPIVIFSFPFFNIYSRASFNTSTSFLIYSNSSLLILHPAYLLPSYSISNFWCFVLNAFPICFNVNGINFKLSHISMICFPFLIVIEYHCPIFPINVVNSFDFNSFFLQCEWAKPLRNSQSTTKCPSNLRLWT